MAKKKAKVNPNRIPITQADLDKAVKEAERRGWRMACVIFYTVFFDKLGFGNIRMNRLVGWVQSLADSIVNKDITLKDLNEVLKNERRLDVYPDGKY